MCIRDRAGILDPAQVTLCLMLALGIVSPLMSATAFINSMKSMQFAVKDTRELLNLPQLAQAEQNVHLEGSSIQMRDVSFSYGGTEGKEVLRHLNLTIPQGKFTALVGPSGGGKSTIARLTARFWDVTGGSITLGGQDIRKLPDVYKRQHKGRFYWLGSAGGADCRSCTALHILFQSVVRR